MRAEIALEGGGKLLIELLRECVDIVFAVFGDGGVVDVEIEHRPNGAARVPRIMTRIAFVCCSSFLLGLLLKSVLPALARLLQAVE